MAKKTAVRYPCLGYCTIDKRGYCVACGRPPSLGLPESCAGASEALETRADEVPDAPASGSGFPAWFRKRS